MNRQLKKLLACVSLVTLAACSGSSKPEDTVNSFWNALEKGDTSSAKAYVAEGAADGMINLSTSADSLIEFAENYELSEETAQRIQDFSSSVISVSYGGHTIQSTEKVSDTGCRVNVNVQVADPASLQNALEQLDYGEALSSYQEEITGIMSEKGAEAAYSRMFELIFVYLSENAGSIAGNIRYTDNPVVMTLEKNEDGSWLITGISEQESN